MRSRTLRRFLLVAALAFSPAASLRAANTTTEDLNRYVGTYELVAGRKLRVYRDGDQLKAQSEGQLAVTLKPETQPGRFTLLEFPVVFQFQADQAGVVTAVELASPNRATKRFRRIVDVRDAVAAAPLHAFEVDAETSVNARVFNGYTRTPAPHGGFATETYAVGNGGFTDYSTSVDPSIDRKSFKQIVQVIAPALARQGYLPATTPEKTDLLVMIYWGIAASRDHGAVIAEKSFDPTQHSFRDQINRQNSRVLGYEAALAVDPHDIFSRGRDLLDELEESRYWVALCAFDYQIARKDKKLKLLWTVRYNLPSVGTNFTAALPQMTEVASRYFGRDSGGLINRPDKTGHIELGETKILGTEPASAR